MIGSIRVMFTESYRGPEGCYEPRGFATLPASLALRLIREDKAIEVVRHVPENAALDRKGN